MSFFRKHWDVLVESLRLQREQDKTARKYEETEFLPAALEVLETPPGPLGRVILWSLL